MAGTKDKDDLFAGESDEFGGFDADFESDDGKKPGETATSFPDGEESASEGQTEGQAQAEEFGSMEETSESGEKAVEPVITEKRKRGRPKGAGVTLKKQAIKPLTAKQRDIRIMLHRAGIEAIPNLSVIMRNKEGIEVAIRDIALFIGTPKDEVLAEIAENLPRKNVVNLSAEVERNRIISVGAEILRAGRMFQPIQLADITEDGKPTGNLQCTSGRHRLAFIALVYGPGVSIPVYVENMTLNEARDAVVVANQARPTRALERAEHAVLGSVGGNADAQQKALYESTATTKTRACKYCVYSVFEKGHPVKLKFPVSSTSSRKDGGVTTVSNVENFWSLAVAWEKGMQWKVFDESLKASVQFLNALVDSMQLEPNFDASCHLASMTLSAIGKWYRAYREITGGDTAAMAPKVAKVIVSLGQIGRQKSETTYAALTEGMRA